MRHIFHPDLPSWAHTLIRVSVSVIIMSVILMALAVYFRSFLLVAFGGLLLFSSVVSFMSMVQVTKPSDKE